MKKNLIHIFLLMLILTSSMAQANGLLRDAEIERTLRLISHSLIKSAGLDEKEIQILVVNDSSMNAFVINGKAIFIHYGLITRLKNVEQLQSVIAHELGHITGGHFYQRISNMGKAYNAATIGTLLSTAIGLVSGDMTTTIGLVAGTNSAVKRAFLSNNRAQEASADQSGIRFMVYANINPKASLEVLNIFEGQNLLSSRRQDPYVLTHPLNSQRISNIKTFIDNYIPKKITKKNNLDYLYARMRAKFIGFTGNPKSTLQNIDINENLEIATYIRSIAYHKMPNIKLAQLEIDRLIKIKPDDPFYNELKGQFLLEIGEAEASVQAYKLATKLAPNELLISSGLGRAYNSIGNHKSALKVLKNVYNKGLRDGRMLYELARAYSQENLPGWASLITAERHAVYGNFSSADTHAKRALNSLIKGSVGWLKAEDIFMQVQKNYKNKR